MMRWLLVIVIALVSLIAVGSIVVVTAVAGLWDPTPPPDIPTTEEVPNALLFDKAEQLEEVKAYRERYNDPRVHSLRMYGLDVTYSIRQCEVTGEPCVKVSEIYPHATLVVWMDKDLKPERIVLWCVDGKGNAHFDKITSNIVEHLRTRECV